MDVKNIGKEFNPYHTTGAQLMGGIRSFILGKENPRWFTRLNCNLAFVYCLYVFIWAFIVLIALEYGKNLPNYENWHGLFLHLGAKYNILNIEQAFIVYLLFLFASVVSIFIGTLFVWRKKKNGYYLVYFGITVTLISPLILMGIEYVKNECGWWEFGIGGLVGVLFFLDKSFLKKNPS